MRMTNPWASSNPDYSLQRADLWTVNLSGVVDLINKDGETKISSADVVNVAVQDVVFPVLRNNPKPVTRGTIPVQMPAYDAPVEAFRLTFLIDTPPQGPESDQYKPSIVLQTLRRWYRTCRAGRGDISIGPGTPLLQFSNGVMAPASVPRCSVGITFVGPNPKVLADILPGTLLGRALQYGLGPSPINDDVLTPRPHSNTFGFVLVGAWVSGFQFENASQRATTHMTATLDVYGEALVPTGPDGAFL